MKVSFKQHICCAFRALSFLLILVLLLECFSFLLQPKNNHRKNWIQNPNSRGFYSEPTDSLDILLIGNSDAYSGFSPMELWNAYGYPSYICAEGHQTLAEGVNILREALRNQHPKLVILETDSIFYNRKPAMRLNDTTADYLQGILPVFRYHNLWKINSLSSMLTHPVYTAHHITKGQKLDNMSKGYIGKNYWNRHTLDHQIPLTTLPFLNEFVQICRENNIPLLMMEIPSASSWSKIKHHLVQTYAKKHGIPFLDLDRRQKDFGLNWRTDTRDGGDHLNSQGAKKLTIYLGRYLSLHYDLTDRRLEPAYASWNTDYQCYLEKLKAGYGEGNRCIPYSLSPQY